MDQFAEAAKRALHDQANQQQALNAMITQIPGIMPGQVVTATVQISTDKGVQNAVKCIFMLPTGPLAMIFDPDFVLDWAEKALKVRAMEAKTGLEVIGNGSHVHP